YRRPRGAANEYLADSFHLRQLLREDRIGGVIHAGQGDDVGSERQNENGRVRRVHLPIRRVARQVCRKLAAGCVDGGLHIERRSQQRRADGTLDKWSGNIHARIQKRLIRRSSTRFLDGVADVQV